MRVFNIVRQQRRTYWVGAAIGAAGSLLGTLLGRQGSQGVDPYMNFVLQRQMFDYQQDRLERLYNSAHQREVEDLKKAGLNPILSATGGSGASSGLASTPDYGSSLGAAASIANTRANNKVMIGQALLGLGEKLLDYSVNSQNANSARMNAEANKMNAVTNMNSSASQIDLNSKQGEYFTSMSNKTKDDLRTNEFIRKNLQSQSFLNYSNAQNIAALQPSIIELNRANANSTPLKIAQGLFGMALDFMTNHNNSNKSNAYEPGFFEKMDSFMSKVGNKYFEINQNKQY